jgi:hypothetical protein
MNKGAKILVIALVALFTVALVVNVIVTVVRSR